MLARRTLLGAGVAGLALGAACPAAGTVPLLEGGFDQALFRQWIELRAGAGRPVWWVSEGTMRAFPSGELLAFVEGFDAGLAHWPGPGAHLAHQYNRKIYLYRDPATGAFLDEVRGVEPIAYPYQFITYRLAGDRIETMVEQGAGPRLQRIGPAGGMTVRRAGDALVFTAPVFLDLPLPSGRIEAFENYDFVVEPGRPLSSAVLSWLRTGPGPAWTGGRQTVMHLVTRRVERWADLPPGLAARVEARYPLWRGPPADLAEIRRLQAG